MVNFGTRMQIHIVHNAFLSILGVNSPEANWLASYFGSSRYHFFTCTT